MMLVATRNPNTLRRPKPSAEGDAAILAKYPQIGIVVNDGVPTYYAFLHGYDRRETRRENLRDLVRLIDLNNIAVENDEQHDNG